MKKTIFAGWFLSVVFSIGSIFCVGAEEASPPVIAPIYINQIGYQVAAPKIALVSCSTGLSFDLVEAGSKKRVLSGMLELTEANDAASGSDLWSADFSIVQATGEFILQIPGLGDSDPFQIQDHMYADVSRQALASFFLHRSGVALNKAFAGKWTRGACHSADGTIFSGTSSNPIVVSATGGWFDGSDYGKYVVHGVYTVGTLLSLYEYFPQAFPDGSLMIPEQSNGVPDILDEIRWELDFFLRMQNAEGAVHHKLTSLEPVKPVLPEKDESVRYIFAPSTAATAGACAVMAKASRLYSPFDATFATQCLQSARIAWSYLESHPTDGGFENPATVRTKTFGDADDSDERFWAALELYLTTQEPGFQSAAKALEKQRIPLLSASGYWGNVIPLAIASILHTPATQLDEDLRKTAIKDLVSLADILLENSVPDGFDLTVKEGEFTWGSNGTLLQNAFILCLADIHTPREMYWLAALNQLHAVLGRNPLSRCYVTGFGKRSPLRPYHLISMTDKIEEPVPGLVVAGPNQMLGDSALKKTFSAEAAPATIYLDSEESISSSETDLIWSAILAFVALYVSH